MGEWMEGFAKLLGYKNAALVDEDEEMVPGEALRKIGFFITSNMLASERILLIHNRTY
jgi:hypothetical protein